jgi:hypothetical protein
VITSQASLAGSPAVPPPGSPIGGALPELPAGSTRIVPVPIPIAIRNPLHLLTRSANHANSRQAVNRPELHLSGVLKENSALHLDIELNGYETAEGGNLEVEDRDELIASIHITSSTRYNADIAQLKAGTHEYFIRYVDRGGQGKAESNHVLLLVANDKSAKPSMAAPDADALAAQVAVEELTLDFAEPWLSTCSEVATMPRSELTLSPPSTATPLDLLTAHGLGWAPEIGTGHLNAAEYRVGIPSYSTAR